MKILNHFSKDIFYLEETLFYEIVQKLTSYDNIQIDEKIIFSATPVFSYKDQEGFILKESFPLKIFIPDFITENFVKHTKEQKKIIIDFLKIFLSKLIYLRYHTEVFKKMYLYTFSFRDKKCESIFLGNKRNMILFFAKYFKEKIIIKEYAPKKIINNKPLFLGKENLYSNLNQNKFFLGSMVYFFLNRVSVFLDVHFSEIGNFKKILILFGMKSHFFIFSSQKKAQAKIYRFYFVFEKSKCLYIANIPGKEFFY
jgi:hypothetical protein